MPLDWLDPSRVPFDAIFLLEREQLSWLPNFQIPQPALARALSANPKVAWFMAQKCPQISGWVDEILGSARTLPPASADEIRQAEVAVLSCMVDLLVYVLEPETYDNQRFLTYDSAELSNLVDFSGKTVIDIGAGTGRLTFVAAPLAKTVFPVEPVGNLRDYMRDKAAKLGFKNVYPVDGLITRIPFPDSFADVTMGGHVFGDELEKEYAELSRVTRPGGMIILCPGNSDKDNAEHAFLLEKGFSWGRFEEPGDGWKRKYWKTVSK